PTNRFLYVVHGDGNKMTAYRIGARGALTPLPGSPFAAVPGIADFTSVAVDPTGRFLYTTDALNEKIREYTLDPVTGAPAIPGSAFPLGNNGAAMVVDPSGRFAYAGAFGGIGDDGVSGYTVDTSTGALSRIAGTPVSVGVLPIDSAVDRTGRHLLVANELSNDVSRFAIDPDTGFPAWLGNTAAGNGPAALAITPSARFAYVANAFDGTVSAYRLDGCSGTLDAVAGSPFA